MGNILLLADDFGQTPALAAQSLRGYFRSSGSPQGHLRKSENGPSSLFLFRPHFVSSVGGRWRSCLRPGRLLVADLMSKELDFMTARKGHFCQSVSQI